MTNTVKTLAAAALMSTLSVPAFAAAHLDLNGMTCEEYNQLGGADRDKVAMMAIMEMNNDSVATDGTATATASSVGEAATESEGATTIAANGGTATATSTTGADDDMSRFAEEMAILNRTCSRNWDAKVTEAAAGQSGTR